MRGGSGADDFLRHVQAELKKMQQNMRIDNKLEKELDDSDIEELVMTFPLCSPDSR